MILHLPAFNILKLQNLKKSMPQGLPRHTSALLDYYQEHISPNEAVQGPIGPIEIKYEIVALRMT